MLTATPSPNMYLIVFYARIVICTIIVCETSLPATPAEYDVADVLTANDCDDHLCAESWIGNGQANMLPQNKGR